MSETTQAGRWHRQISQERPVNLEFFKISFLSQDKIKTFSDEQRLREFIASRHTLKEILKAVLRAEGKLHHVEIWTYTKKRKLLELLKNVSNIK